MEKRIGTALIIIENKSSIKLLNEIISRFEEIIIARQGLPVEESIRIISLILHGTTDEIGALTGQIGKLNGIQIKSVLAKYSRPLS